MMNGHNFSIIYKLLRGILKLFFKQIFIKTLLHAYLAALSEIDEPDE